MSILDIFAPGISGWIKVAVVGGVALISAGVATFTTANYYNNKIIGANEKQILAVDAAVQKAGEDAAAGQKQADAKMTTARLADQRVRDLREKADAVVAAQADAFLHDHPASTDVACVMPKDVAHAINQVLGNGR